MAEFVQSPDVKTGTSLIRLAPSILHALKIADKLLETKKPDAFLFTAIINKCRREGAPQQGLNFYENMVASRVLSDEILLSSFAAACLEAQQPELFRRAFTDWRGAFTSKTCRVFIRGFSNFSDLDYAFIAYKKLIKDHKPNNTVWGALIDACRFERGQPARALSIWDEVCTYAMTPDLKVYSSLVAASVEAKSPDYGRKLFEKAKLGLDFKVPFLIR